MSNSNEIPQDILDAANEKYKGLALSHAVYIQGRLDERNLHKSDGQEFLKWSIKKYAAETSIQIISSDVERSADEHFASHLYQIFLTEKNKKQ